MPYHSTARATHDLAHLAELSGEPSLILYVSERTSYILSNLAAAEIANPSAYATEFAPEWYRPVVEEDDEWELFLAVVERAQDELVEVDMQRFYGVDYADLTGHQMLDVEAGNYTMDIDPVPEGEVWEINQMHVVCNPAPTRIIFRLVDGAGQIDVGYDDAPSNLYGSTWQGKVYLSEGQNPACRVTGAPEGADITFYVWYAVLV
jgi:hypothetical protein